MKYPDAKNHEFVSALDSPFCDHCLHPASDHAIPECETVVQYAATTTPRTLGQIVHRKKDGLYFMTLAEWNGHEWHPLTVGYQSGLFADARDRFASWKLMAQRWEYATPEEKAKL